MSVSQLASRHLLALDPNIDSAKFLNSVLNNIGKPGESPAPPPPPNTTKRKAEDEVERPNGKTNKTSSSSRPSPIPIQLSSANGKNGLTKPLDVSYRGTGRPGSSSAPTTPTAETTKQLKKGSFREIMARAKAGNVQESKPVVGTISHRPLPKELSRKKDQRLQRRKSAVEVKDGSRTNSSERGDHSDNRATNTGKKKKEKRPPPSYSGTAKPKPREQPSYKGTAGARPSAAKPQVKSKQSRNEYAGTDDEIDSYGEDEDDGYGYSGDESDDMEAGYLDVEQEESAALRFARKEDEEELRRENASKKQKDDKKKKRLEELAKRAAPRRY